MTGGNGAVAQLDDVTHVYGKVAALNAVTLTLPAARMVAGSSAAQESKMSTNLYRRYKADCRAD